MILGGNDESSLWVVVYGFQWELVLLFILICLFCTDTGVSTCQLVARCGYVRWVISSLFKVEVFKGDGCMVAVIDQLLTQEVAEVERRISEIQGLEQKLSRISRHPEVQSHADRLERSLNQPSPSAEIADCVTRLQRLSDEAEQFTRERKFWNIKEVTYLALKELAECRGSFGPSVSIYIPDSVFSTLMKGLKAHVDSLNRIQSSLTVIVSSTSDSGKSSRRQLEALALSTEVLAEELEDNLEFLSFEILELLDTFFQEIVIKSRDKQSLQDSQRRGTEARRRLRFAAGFILNLVEMAREDVQSEDDNLGLLYLRAADLTAEC
jgi:hypothetical protein